MSTVVVWQHHYISLSFCILCIVYIMAIYRCNSCSATFTSTRNHRRHLRVHRRYRCRGCDLRFSTPEEAERHWTTHRVTVGTQTNTFSNFGCRLLTPTKCRQGSAAINYVESETSRLARLRATDPLGLAQPQDSEDLLASSDEDTRPRNW